MRKIKAFILSYLILILLWLALTGWKGDELIIGSLSAVILAWVFSARLIIMAEFRLSPKSLWFSFVYIFVFLRELVKSAVDVARRVISPALPINPGS
jgi:multicomponent Na+:H+ antiporter subunit E